MCPHCAFIPARCSRNLRSIGVSFVCPDDDIIYDPYGPEEFEGSDESHHGPESLEDSDESIESSDSFS